MEVTITTENIEQYRTGELPLVVDLWATWCGPCRMIAPIVSKLAEEYDGKIVVGKGSLVVGSIFENRLSVTRSFGQFNGTGNQRLEDLVPKERTDLINHLVGKIGAGIVHSENNSKDIQARV